MLGYALRRLILAIPLLIGITLISFSVIHLAPGEPTELATGDTPIQSDKEVRERLGQMYGLDKPPPVPDWDWLARLRPPPFGAIVFPGAPPRRGKNRQAVSGSRRPHLLWRRDS